MNARHQDAHRPRRGLQATLIIPTYNRASILSGTLARLAADDCRRLLQVIICDDGSSDETASVAAEFATRLPLVYLHQEDLGFRAAAARNMGIRQADGDVLIFLDDDCVPMPGFVNAHCELHAASSEIVGLGLRRRIAGHDTTGSAAGRLSPDAEPDDRLSVLSPGLATHPYPWKLLYSCNSSLRRDHPEAYFDERFQGWGMEDTELGYRLWMAGAHFQVADRATVFHVDDDIPRDPFRRERLGVEADYLSYLLNCWRLLDKYPNEPDLWSSLLPDLRWYQRDPSTGRWAKDGHEHDAAALLEALAHDAIDRASTLKMP